MRLDARACAKQLETGSIVKFWTIIIEFQRDPNRLGSPHPGAVGSDINIIPRQGPFPWLHFNESLT